jgi:tetratricopeptide (TPR) repeat protein
MAISMIRAARAAEQFLMSASKRMPLIVLLCLTWISSSWGQQRLPDGTSRLELTPSLFRDLPLPPEVEDSLKRTIQERHYEQAEIMLMKQSEHTPESAALFKVLGSVLFLNGQYVNAAIAFKKSDALHPLDNTSRFTLAMACVAFGRNDWARLELEKLAASGERNPHYYYWLSRLDYNDQNFASSLGNAKRALEIDPSFARAHESIGLSDEALGRYEEAVQAYRLAVQLSSSQRRASPWPAMELGALLVKLGRLEDASTYLRESMRRDGRFPKAHFQMGLLLEKQGKLNEAIAQLNEAAAVEPSYAEPHYVLGRIYRMKGEREAAAVAFREFYELSRRQKGKAILPKLSR